MTFLRARSLAMGFSGARPVVVETMLAVLEPRRHAGRTRARVARRQRGPRPPGVGRPGPARRGRRRASPTARSSTAPRRCAAAGVAPVVLRAKEGLALINGTDGMLGMLVLALADLDVLLRTADIAGALSTEALLGTDRAFAADLVAMRPQVGQADERGEPAGAARRLGDRRQPPPRRRPGPGRLLAALHAAGPRRGARHRRARPRRSPSASWCRSSTTRSCCPTAASSRAATSTARPVAAVADFLAISIADVGALSERRTDRLLDPTRSHGPAAVPRARRRRELGPDDRPVHAGGDGGREPPPGRPGEHRHAADERHAGGPRLARLVGRPQAARRRRQPGPHPRRRAGRRVVGRRTAGTAEAGRRHRRPPPAASSTAIGGPGPDEWLAPRLAAVEHLVLDGAVVAAADSALAAPLG